MRRAFRFLLPAALILLATASTHAQEKKAAPEFARNVFAFSAVPLDRPNGIKAAVEEKEMNLDPNLLVRPNAATELYLWVLNPTQESAVFTVQLAIPGKDGKAGTTIKTKTSEIPGETWMRVKLEKLAPPVPAKDTPTAPPTPPAKEQPAVLAPEPPPPGVEVAITRDSHLELRLLDKDGKQLLEGGKPYGRDVKLGLLAPQQYLANPRTEVTPGQRITLTSVVAQNAAFRQPGSASVQLSFPQQDALAGMVLRDGVFRRELKLSVDPAKIESVTLRGVIDGETIRRDAASNRLPVRAYLGVDGIERAYIYDLNASGAETAQLRPTSAPGVRATLVPGTPLAAAPTTARFPVLIEVDNPEPADRLELRVQPLTSSDALRETVPVEGTRDERIWVQTSGPNDGGLLLTSRSKDWVKTLDLSNHRGKVEILAVLERIPRKGEPRVLYSRPVVVTIDGTPPERISFGRIPRELEKGKPLPVSATVNDPETDIVKAMFFLCKQLDDGKIPADAIKVEGRPSGNVWTAELKLPPEFRGDGIVGVVFTNRVGLSNESPRVQEVRIVEAVPKLPVGTIEGKVEFGGRPQPGVAVTLRDMDNKEKAATKTDDKGKFKFENVPPGNYIVGSAKKDSSYGASGTAPVTVEADKTAKPTIAMSKNRG